MAGRSLAPVLRHIRRLAAPPSDGELLDRFHRHADESAFAELVRRHGPSVLGTCRRVLRDAHAAEDAFQATFLVLARRSGSLSRPEALSAWLHGVACRVAMKARTVSARRLRHEANAARPEAAPWTIEPPDLRPVLDQEIARLPGPHRRAVVLCYLEGKTNEEAARLLGWPPGTVATRLAWARRRLRQRLDRRGLAPAAVPGVLAAATARAAVESLKKGVGPMVGIAKLTLAVVALAAAALVGTGVRPAGRPEAPPKPEPAAKAPPAAMPELRQLIDHLNANAARIQTVECRDVQIDIRERMQSVGVSASLLCRKPGDVRLVAKVMGAPAFDLGANGREFWVWFRPNDGPRLVRQPRDGEGRWPLLLTPDDVFAALGVAEYDPARATALTVRRDTLELTEDVKLPDGRFAKRVTEFTRRPDPIRVRGWRLLDGEKELVRVTIEEARRDEASGAVVARRLELESPADKTRVTVVLDDVRVNVPIDDERAGRAFLPPAFRE
jgi:RNA polymerase sigma factor (sigma-70 family)